jgi:hypothetical protein
MEITLNSKENQKGGTKGTRRIQDSKSYKKPEGGTLQSNFTSDKIKEKLNNYKRMNKKDLEQVKMGTWIKYVNRSKKEFRVGGVITKLDIKSGYMILRNPYSNISWSVQIKENVFFVPDTGKMDEIKEAKDELFRLYEEGKLELKKD